MVLRKVGQPTHQNLLRLSHLRALQKMDWLAWVSWWVGCSRDDTLLRMTKQCVHGSAVGWLVGRRSPCQDPAGTTSHHE
jgi:hypothetical protein